VHLHSSSPTAPIIFTCISESEPEFDLAEAGLGRESRAHATAWLAPFPPGPVENEDAVRVSPPAGTRGVTVTRSVLSEPITVMVLAAILEMILTWLIRQSCRNKTCCNESIVCVSR
jgi:hypothetical protein